MRLSEAAELPPDSLTSVTCAQCEQGVRCFTPHSQSVCLAVWTETGTGPPPPPPEVNLGSGRDVRGPATGLLLCYHLLHLSRCAGPHHISPTLAG